MKQNKLIVAVAPDDRTRKRIIQRILMELNFAYTPSDANKLIRSDVHDLNLLNAYYVCADNFQFSDSPITVQRLYEMAARGIAVILGVSRLPRAYEFICEAYYG